MKFIDITEIDAEYYWGAFAMLVLAVLFTVLTLWAVKDHSIKSYYLTSEGAGSLTCKWDETERRSICTTSTCIYADVPWNPDFKVYCTSEIDKGIEQVEKLNKTLRP